MQWIFGNSTSKEKIGDIPVLSTSTPQGRSAPAALDNSTYKDEGNHFYKQKRYSEAIESYTIGINKYPSAVLYSNRSAAYTALGRYSEAAADAELAIQMDPFWAKTYSRKGKALYGLNQYKRAADAYARGLALSLKAATDEARQRDAELLALKKQTENQTEEYLKSLNEVEALKKQVADYELLFGDWLKKST